MSFASLAKGQYQILKELIYKLDNGIYHICKTKVAYNEATLDHIIPTAISGRGNIDSTDEYWNLRLAHRKCNWKRSNAKIAGQLRLNLPTIQKPLLE